MKYSFTTLHKIKDSLYSLLQVFVTWWKATMLDYPCWRLIDKNGRHSRLFYWIEADLCKRLFGGKPWIDFNGLDTLPLIEQTSDIGKPITHAALVLLGYTHHVCDYYCPPPPANGSTYRLEFKATHFKGNKPVEGAEEWRAFLTHSDEPTIRRFKTLGELRDFHKGMCGGILF